MRLWHGHVTHTTFEYRFPDWGRLFCRSKSWVATICNDRGGWARASEVHPTHGQPAWVIGCHDRFRSCGLPQSPWSVLAHVQRHPVAVWSGQTLSNMRLHPPLEKRCYRIVSSRNHPLWHGPDPPIGCEFVPRNLQIRPLTQIQRTCVGIGMKMYEVNIAKQVSHLPYKDRQG